MWVQVRSMDGKTSVRIDGLSKLTKIEELRLKLVEPFAAPTNQQRLYYRGKQLEDGLTLFDYCVALNDIIQILIRPAVFKNDSSASVTEGKHNGTPVSGEQGERDEKEKNKLKLGEAEVLLPQSKYFKVGDFVDVKDKDHGAWFEATVVGIKYIKIHDLGSVCVNATSETAGPSHSKYPEKNVMHDVANSGGNMGGVLSLCPKVIHEDSVEYIISYIDYEDGHETVPLSRVRPRAKRMLKFEEINEGDEVMVNYNVEKPNNRGFWYDCKITKKKTSKTREREMFATLYLGLGKIPLENCQIQVTDEIFAIENLVPISEKTVPSTDQNIPRTTLKCSYCHDDTTKKCKQCSCHVCGGKDHPTMQILCDECDLPFHIWCLNPPLSAIPDSDEWYCPSCKNDENEIVKAGEKLKESKKKSKMASSKSTSKRDWGKGMACVGRTKECTIVPHNHFGAIPGVEVGSMWKFRVQVSESGVHRPHVAGIHGREHDGAFSIVLSGGYEDDVDNGEEFEYTGSGGRDLSGNKRTANQSCDQKLTRMNKALALNCAAKLDDKEGAEASDWKKGKPVRVVRNCKGRSHSKYCPVEGNRYDGLYKVVKYWPGKGKSGFLVWRYLLRRDDPVPPPWSKAGKKRIADLGLTMQYPDGYEQSHTLVKAKDKKKSNSTTKTKRKEKRPHEENAESSSTKKMKKMAYVLPAEVDELISQDALNEKQWIECKSFLAEGNAKFLEQVQSMFLCICCQEIVVGPITTECHHNICKTCLQRSFMAEVYCCPMCRHSLGKHYSLKINEILSSVLQKLFPGYEVGR